MTNLIDEFDRGVYRRLDQLAIELEHQAAGHKPVDPETLRQAALVIRWVLEKLSRVA